MAEETSQTAPSAFQWHGKWAEFMPIALTNLLLTIVTLGIYRFWATTRERQYLWSRSQFIDERLEWTGTGKELFIGFLAVLVLIFIPFFGIQFLAQALILRGMELLAALLTFGMIFFIFYLTGVARFRALRYRLGRSYWHGIRGGSDDQGLNYGWSYLWKTIVGYLPLGLMVPWSMMGLWNERWNKMSFGPHPFRSTGEWGDTFARYLLFYLSPIFLIIGTLLLGGAMAAAGMAQAETPNPAMMAVSFVLFILIFYGGLGLIALAFYAKFFRVAVDSLSLHSLEFSFGARTADWLLLFLGHLGLWLLAAIPVFGILGAFGALAVFGQFEQAAQTGGALPQFLPLIIIAISIIPFMLVGPFIRYRNWRFFITHMEAYGEIDLDALTQSGTQRSKHGEGLLDAFDVGAI